MGKRNVTLFLRSENCARSFAFKSVCFAWLYLHFNPYLRSHFDTAVIYRGVKEIGRYRRALDVIDDCYYWERVR